MATKAIIRINYNNAKRQAKELIDCAAAIRSQIRKLSDVETNLRSGWDGDAAQVYYGKHGDLKTKLEKSASNLDKIASTINRAAEAYYKAEMRALEIAKSRGGGSGGGGFR